MAVPEDFWTPWEKEISSFDEINTVINDIFTKWVQGGRLFAWRGVANARWALHSSLFRRLLLTNGGPTAPDEKALRRVEAELLKRVHQWGLHHSTRGRLSILGQLATLQHFGAHRLVLLT
jgi:hypothetical protein